MGIVSDEGADEFVRAIISMGHTMKMEIIAEGVEEYAQVLALRDLGCEMIQGYYYSKPIPIEEYEEKYLQVQ